MDELVPAGAMTSMEARMTSRKSGSAGACRRGCGPVTAAYGAGSGTPPASFGTVQGRRSSWWRRKVLAVLPVGQALP